MLKWWGRGALSPPLLLGGAEDATFCMRACVNCLSSCFHPTAGKKQEELSFNLRSSKLDGHISHWRISHTSSWEIIVHYIGGWTLTDMPFLIFPAPFGLSVVPCLRSMVRKSKEKIMRKRRPRNMVTRKTHTAAVQSSQMCEEHKHATDPNHNPKKKKGGCV